MFVYNLVNWLLTIYCWIIIARALISWVNPDPYNPIVVFLRRVTDPVLEPVRRLLPPWKTAGLDLSPMIVLIAIQLVQWKILPSLVQWMVQPSFY